MIRPLVLTLAIAWPWAVGAAVLDLPSNASLTLEQNLPNADYEMAIGPFSLTQAPVEQVTGPLIKQSWRIDAQGLTTLQILEPLRAQLAAREFETVYECDTNDCGGFDFRFGQDVIAEPDMHIDLGNFRYLAAKKDTNWVSLIVSSSEQSGFVQVTSIGTTETSLTEASQTAVQAERVKSTAPIAVVLEQSGFTELSDLAFETGSSKLADGTYTSLVDLAEYLSQNPNRKIALVGHTDSEGSLDGNIALSKRRAASVLERLVSEFGVERRQMEAQGMGYLSPVASNLTPEGREANRRVEVIVTSTQ